MWSFCWKVITLDYSDHGGFPHPSELRILVTGFFVVVLLLKLTHSNSFTLTCGEGVLYLYCLTHFNKEFKELHLLACGIQSGLFEIAVP